MELFGYQSIPSSHLAVAPVLQVLLHRLHRARQRHQRYHAERHELELVLPAHVLCDVDHHHQWRYGGAPLLERVRWNCPAVTTDGLGASIPTKFRRLSNGVRDFVSSQVRLQCRSMAHPKSGQAGVAGWRCCARTMQISTESTFGQQTY